MMSWRHRAACLDQPIEWFFPIRGGTGTRGKKVCADCPVRLDCLDFAMSFPDGENPGIYGGTTEAERRQMREYRYTG